MAKISKEQKRKLTILKRKGLVSIDLRKNTTTRYQLSKINRFRDVISGDAIVTKIDKKQKVAFKKSGAFSIFGDKLIVKSTTPYEKLTNKNGLIKAKSNLANGQMTRIILPYSSKNILDLVDKIQRDENLPEYLDGQGDNPAQYAFSIGGHKSLMPFASKSALVDYVKGYYNHLFNQNLDILNFQLIYFNSGDSELPELTTEIGGEKLYSPSGEGRKFAKADATGRSGSKAKKISRKLKINAERSKAKRKKMTPQERAEYNAKGRERANRSNRNNRDKKDK